MVNGPAGIRIIGAPSLPLTVSTDLAWPSFPGGGGPAASISAPTATSASDQGIIPAVPIIPPYLEVAQTAQVSLPSLRNKLNGTTARGLDPRWRGAMCQARGRGKTL